MRFQNILLMPMLFIALGACSNDNDTKQKEFALKEKELELREKELRLKEAEAEKSSPTFQPVANGTIPSVSQPIENLPSIKFVYVVFKVKEPKLHHTDSKYTPSIDDIHGGTTLPETNYVTYDTYTYTSDIKEIPSYNEDRQYEYMDQMEASVRRKLTYIDMNFDGEVFTHVGDREDQARLKENRAQIIDRKLKTFNSYKEASLARNQNKGTF